MQIKKKILVSRSWYVSVLRIVSFQSNDDFCPFLRSQSSPKFALSIIAVTILLLSFPVSLYVIFIFSWKKYHRRIFPFLHHSYIQWIPFKLLRYSRKEQPLFLRLTSSALQVYQAFSVCERRSVISFSQYDPIKQNDKTTFYQTYASNEKNPVVGFDAVFVHSRVHIPRTDSNRGNPRCRRFFAAGSRAENGNRWLPATPGPPGAL